MKPKFQADAATVYHGDARDYLREIPDCSVHVVVTSSDYWKQLDHYHAQGQIGMTPTPETFIDTLSTVFDQCKRVLVEGGCLFQIMADTQNNHSMIREPGQTRKTAKYGANERRGLVPGYREKEPLDIPYRLSAELRRRGWLKRQNMIWNKGASGDPTQSDGAVVAHEPILFMFKWSAGGRPYANCSGFPSTVLTHAPYRDPQGVHPCPFPPSLAREILTYASQPGETVLDPFGGAGTVAGVALDMGRRIVTGDLLDRYCDRIVSEITGECAVPGGIQKSLFA